MTTVNIAPAFQSQLEQIAQSVGKSTEQLVNEAIEQHLERLRTQQLEIEIDAFERMHPELKNKYSGQFVAIHNKQVVGNNLDFESLFLQMQTRFGDLPVLIRQVKETPEETWHFRSPRVENEL